MQILKSNLAYQTPGGFSIPIKSALWREPHLFDYALPTYHAAITAKTQANPMDSYVQAAMDANERPVNMPVGLIPIENALTISTQGRGMVGPGEGYGFLSGISVIQASAACRLKWNGDSTRTVSAITKANPGQITLSAAAPASWVTGKPFCFRTIAAGMTELSGVRGILTKIDSTTFTIGIDTTGYTTFSGTAVIAEGDPIIQIRPPLNAVALSGITLGGFMLDCNGFSKPGINIESTSNSRYSRICIFAPISYGLRTGTVDYTLNTIFGAYGTQTSLFDQVMVSMFGGSGEYLTSTARGFWLTSGSAVNTGNTSLNVFQSCRGHTAKGRPWYLESCDDNFLRECIGQAVRDATLEAIEYASSAQDSYSLDGGTARYNTISGGLFQSGTSVSAARARAGVASSHDNSMYGLSRADAIGLVTVEAGASLWYIDTNGNTRLFTQGLKDGITAPTAIADLALQYVDTADGDLKERYGDNVTKVIVADT